MSILAEPPITLDAALARIVDLEAENAVLRDRLVAAQLVADPQGHPAGSGLYLCDGGRTH